MNVFQAPQITMTTEEAEAVVRRHLERVPATPDGPSIADVAEALKVRPEEIAGLLAEVRAETRVKAPRRKVARRERRVWLLSGALAILMGGMGLGVMKNMAVGPFRHYAPSAYSPPIGKPFQIFIDGQHIGGIYYDSQKGPVETVLPKKLERSLRDERWRFHRGGEPVSDQVVEEARRAVSSGKWGEAPGVRIASVELRKGDYGDIMRWARATVPIYEGDDALVFDAVAKERERRMAAAVKIAMKGLPTPPSR